MQEADCIRVHGARTHNLQNLDLALPRDRLVVVTGPSGSGKSSLAFDTLYAEGQRQYIESLSPYARQFLHQLERPDVDLIEGLQPTISIDQRAGSHNPRSTVATVTEIYDYLRLLYARLGESTCYQCGTPIRQQSPEQILETLLCPAHRHADDDPGADRSRPQRPAPRGDRGHPQGRVRPRADRRRGARGQRAAGTRAAEGPHDRGHRRSHRDPRRRRTAAGRVDPPGRPPWRGAGAGQLRSPQRRQPSRSGATSFSARSIPAPTARSATKSSSRGPSASTAPTAPARRARASAPAWPSTRTW